MSSWITIDGTRGEGGGQILRTSLSLSAITGTPFSIDGIRAGRSRPGLMRQHLAAVEAAAAVCGAQVEGAVLGSRSLSFRPGRVQCGDHHFAISTAGSACLVFQTVLWPLLTGPGPSRVVFEGGTHNPHAPPFDFLDRTLVPLLRRMGASVELRLERHGFYPAGGGYFVANLQPCPRLERLELAHRGALVARRARALVSQLTSQIALRELKVVKTRLGWDDRECRPQELRTSRGPGNLLLLEVEHEEVTCVVTGFGERGVPAETVASRACGELERYLATGVPVGEHLCDQLIIPLALAGGGSVRTLPLSSHTTTNLDVTAQFLPVTHRVVTEREGDPASPVQLILEPRA
jgi:RNA 3'-terminal phosphate cyclase (ATP)